MATDRNLYLAVSELSRRYADSGARAGGPLTAYELRCFSQNGEDGVIAEILARIGITQRFFVEFGVESGHEGNCVFLADVERWDGLFMEANPDHFHRLAAKYAATSSIQVANAAVTPGNVERLFAAAGVPEQPDVLSIDIDGGDYWVWEALRTFSARLVVIEYNSALAPSTDRLPSRATTRGAGPGPTTSERRWRHLRRLAARKGYRLVHTEMTGAMPSSSATTSPTTGSHRRPRSRGGASRTTSCRASRIPMTRAWRSSSTRPRRKAAIWCR